MAFTVAHMAAALPLYRYRRWLDFEALLIGTMMPDLPYFLSQGNVVSQQAHQWSGIVSYGLPWGMLVFVLWHWWFKSAALALIQPWSHSQNQQGKYYITYDSSVDELFKNRALPKLKYWLVFWVKVIVGLSIGAATHLIWDGTTHPSGFIAEQIDIFQQIVTLPLLGSMAVARLLQYLSSIVGLLLLLYFAYSQCKLKQNNLSDLDLNSNSRHYFSLQPFMLRKRYSLIIIGFISVTALICSLQAARKWHTLLTTDYYLFLAKILVSSLQGSLVVFIGYALLYQSFSLVRDAQLRPNS